YLREMSKGISGIIKFGTVEDAHVIGKAVRSEPFLEVEITQGMENGNVKTKLVGDYNLPNVLAAVTVGKNFKVREEKIREAIARYSRSNSACKLNLVGSNKIILVAYNANPSSMRLAIENFANLYASKE